ncbi:MAG: hypothetical protein HY332_25620 [Chloroflexi bacterium]|nr:hypothetical protein [Chloroflexota bacterium]
MKGIVDRDLPPIAPSAYRQLGLLRVVVAAVERPAGLTDTSDEEAPPAYVPPPETVYTLLDPEKLAPRAERFYRERTGLHWLEVVRNTMLVVPVLVTWISLSLASAAYQASVAGVQPAAVPESFQQLWERGFAVASVQYGVLHLPLVINGWRWFTFSFVAGVDATLVFCAAVLIAATYWGDQRVAARLERLRTELDDELAALHGALSRYHAAGRESDGRRIERLLAQSMGQFARAANGAVGALGTTAEQMSRLVASRERQEAALERSADTLRFSVDGLLAFTAEVDELFRQQHEAIASVKASLAEVLEQQNKSRHTLEDAAAGITAAAAAIGETGLLNARLVGHLDVSLATAQQTNLTLERQTRSHLEIASSLRARLESSTAHAELILEQLREVLAGLLTAALQFRLTESRAADAASAVYRRPAILSARPVTSQLAPQPHQPGQEQVSDALAETLGEFERLTDQVTGLQAKMQSLVQRLDPTRVA